MSIENDTGRDGLFGCTIAAIRQVQYTVPAMLRNRLSSAPPVVRVLFHSNAERFKVHAHARKWYTCRLPHSFAL